MNFCPKKPKNFAGQVHLKQSTRRKWSVLSELMSPPAKQVEDGYRLHGARKLSKQVPKYVLECSRSWCCSRKRFTFGWQLNLDAVRWSRLCLHGT
jgi:hypothetical protein